MRAGVVSEWYAVGDVQAADVRAGIRRSRLGWPQVLHHHREGEQCGEQCETIDDPVQVAP